MAAHRYWRLFSVKSNNTANTGVCELEMFTSLGGTNVCTGGTAASSSNYAGWEPAKAFDGIKTGDQGWLASAGGGTHYLNQWLSYDFGVGNEVEIIQVAVTSRSSYPLDTPNLFAIEWSDDGITWTQKGYIPPQTSWGANETRTFDIVNELSAEMSAVSLASRSFTHRINRPASFKKSTTGGDGSLGGTVLESSAPVQGAIITVFDETTHAVAGQGTTNILGDWVVDNINPNKTYFAVAKHPDDLWEMKISSRRKPSRVNTTIRPSFLLGEHSSAILTAVGEIADPHWASVVSLLHFDGADGSTTFTDEKGRTWTASGNAQIDTAQSKFGGASALFDGSGDYISAPASTDLDVSTDDFTAEAFIRLAAGETTAFIMTNRAQQNVRYANWQIAVIGGKLRCEFADQTTGGQGTIRLSEMGATTISTEVWHHVALVKEGLAVRLYLDGLLDGSWMMAAHPAPDVSRPEFLVGYELGGTTSDFLSGHIDELRITKGVARYTSNFTPPSAPFPNPPPFDPHWASVVSLLHFDGANGSTTFTDETGQTWTANGNVQIDTAQSKFGGSSCFFDGQGDYLSPALPGISLDNTVATVELWAWVPNPTSWAVPTGNSQAYSSDVLGQSNTNAHGEQNMGVGADGALFLSLNRGESGNAWASAASAVPWEQWTHLAWVIDTNQVRGYVDGVQVFSATTSRKWADLSAPLTIGYSNVANYPQYKRFWNGYMDELRITKGVARYTTNFTPPTAPFSNS